MFNSQDGKCAICRQQEKLNIKSNLPKRLAVDHCHNSNKIRELLCSRCNIAIGQAEDNIELLEKMKQYLIKHRN